MQAQLGSISYRNLKSYSAISRGRSVSLDEIRMIEGKPRVQATGAGLDSISLTFLFHAAFCNPSDEVARLHDAMTAFEVLPFIWGNGAVLGNFGIESVNDTTRKSDALGNIIYCEVDVKLKEIPPADRLAQDQLQAIKQGFAYSQSTVPKTPIAIQPTAFASGAASRNLCINNAQSAGEQIELAQRVPSKADASLAKIKALTSAASIAALEAANAVRGVQAQLNDAERIIQDAEDTARFASDMANSLDIEEATNTNIAYQEATARFKKSAAILVTIVASRG